jgi:hypothetical protein
VAAVATSLVNMVGAIIISEEKNGLEPATIICAADIRLA